VVDAARILAHRRAITAHGGVVAQGWIDTTAATIGRTLSGVAHGLLFEFPELTPAELADILDRAPADREVEATRRRIRDTLAAPGARVRSAEHAAALRQQLRPTEAPRP
jgi:hypothetical protein